MSLKVGGVGLNLTAASSVFLMVQNLPFCFYFHPTLSISSFPMFFPLLEVQNLPSNLQDPWWNPAVEEQAIMRIHRIGQKRTVSVRRFIVKVTQPPVFFLYA